MLAVAIVAIPLWLIPPAFRVARAREPHLHLWVIPDAQAIPGTYPCQYKRGTPWGFNHRALTPFWPRYLRAIAGLPWRKQAVCGAGAGHLIETCEFARPGMVTDHRGDMASGWVTPKEITDEVFRRYPEEEAAAKRQVAEFERLKKPNSH